MLPAYAISMFVERVHPIRQGCDIHNPQSYFVLQPKNAKYSFRFPPHINDVIAPQCQPPTRRNYPILYPTYNKYVVTIALFTIPALCYPSVTAV